MASPIGHALLGYAIGRGADRRGLRETAGLLGVCALLAVAPDLDFLPGIWLGKPALYHQGASHSLLVAIAVGAVTACLWFREPRARLGGAALFSAAWASHLLIDLFGPDGRPPIGIPLFWPLSDATFLSPWTLLPGIHHAAATDTATGAWLGSVLSWRNAGAVGLEVGLLGALAVGAELRARRADRTDRAAPAAGTGSA